ncbi:MAG: ABC transporter permease [Dongiaceae bacterium]
MRRPSVARLGLLAVVVVGFLFIYLPIGMLVLFSFADSSFVAFPISGFTTRWYAELLADRRILEGVGNSLVVGLVTAALATVAGTGAAFTLVRVRFPGKELVRAVILMPLMIPGIMLGLSLLSVLVALHVRRDVLTIILGHSTFTTSFVTMVVAASLHGVDPALEEAARDLYAGPVRAFFRVTLPLIAPGMLAGALFAFTLSFDEYVVAFLNSGTAATIPIVIMGMMKYGLSPKINALGALIYAASFVLALAATLLQFRGRRAPVRAGG